MSWLRIDDGYDSHPKLIELTEQQRWRWTRVLIHCARHRTDGHVKKSVLREVGLARLIPKLLVVGLLHENGEEGYLVHDWRVYNADTVAGKVAAFLTEHADASANEICRAVGGKRELVLAEIAVQRGSLVVPDRFPPGSPEPDEGGSLPVPDRYQSGSRARAPVPSPQELPPVLPAEARDQPNGRTARRPNEIEAQRLEPAAILAAAHPDDDIPL